MKTLAITGGNGFIGKATQEAAKASGHWDHIKVLDRPNSIMFDLTPLKGADHVIHLAGMLGTSELFQDPYHAIDINIKGTLRILEWCVNNGASYTGITMPPVFPSIYTATKVAADRLASAWHYAYDLPVSKVRAFNAYGAGQKHGIMHPQKILPTFATEAWAGRPIPIWGNGEQMVDLVHVDDIGRALTKAAFYGGDQTFDAGTGRAITVNELAEYVLDVTESKAGKKYLPMRKGELPGIKICAEGEGWNLLDWKPEFTWTKIQEAIVWYKPVNDHE